MSKSFNLTSEDFRAIDLEVACLTCGRRGMFRNPAEPVKVHDCDCEPAYWRVQGNLSNPKPKPSTRLTITWTPVSGPTANGGMTIECAKCGATATSDTTVCNFPCKCSWPADGSPNYVLYRDPTILTND